MSNIDKIRQEIERRKKICEGIFERESDTYYQGKAVAYGELLPFIDSLPEEKPSEDLNDEIKKFIEEYGYERGEDKLLIAIVARHFAEWQKGQMMKDAVEGEIGYWNQRGLSIRLDQSFEKLGYGEDTKVKIIIVKED